MSDSKSDIMKNDKNRLQPEQLLSTIFNAADIGFLAVAHDGITILANKIAREDLNITSGIKINEAHPKLWSLITKSLREKRSHSDIYIRDVEKNYLLKISPILDNKKVSGAACVFVESTELEQMAKKMNFYQELAQELDAIIDSSSDGLWICDADAKVIRINPASERINKIQSKDVIGCNMRDLVNKSMFDKSATLEVLRSCSTVNMLQTRDGRKLITTGTPVFDSNGKVIRVVVSERDITEIDNLQRALEEQEAIKDQIRNQMLEMQRQQLKEHKIIAHSPNMVKALSQAIKVSGVESTVLIMGESGVGKGLFADLIHKLSARSGRPLIKINCGAIPDSLIESELFGYEKGAFTGAQSAGKPGYFELADGGILFLDEIAELPLSSQVKLLRFLEDGRILRLGSTRERKVNVRILAATHRNLEKMVDDGKFRLDLYYRLKVIPINVPALQERKECILPLLLHYIDFFASKHNTAKRLSRAATDNILSYSFPGNVRELMNLCERLVVMSETELIDLQDLPTDIAKNSQHNSTVLPEWLPDTTMQQAIERTEKTLLAQAIKKHGNQMDIAAALGISQPTVARKLKKYSLT